ncbi:MAG: soluble lytic transglycosylase fused to an ABC-type amino acid-binding protein [Nitrospirae bacterium]|nr:MAG: soluble lytic transglycosylase fused to an ABC-type amino acid-binding protein [Nitrospirota bacterium]
MSAIVQFVKSVLVSVLIGMGVVLLWEIPQWEQQSIAQQEIPTMLEHQLPPFDTKTFLRHISTRLPRYREQFEQAADRYGLPWTLLAAQAYQESKWNRNAMSHTGVRGIMMLTRATARDLGIENRLDVDDSIMGGARYLARLLRQVPPHIPHPDRMFMALAAYNVGMGHLKDARLLAKRLGKDPDRWDDLKTVLPLLAKKKYYQTLPHRYARGWEPVQYVKRIRAYQEILEHMAIHQARPDAAEL